MKSTKEQGRILETVFRKIQLFTVAVTEVAIEPQKIGGGLKRAVLRESWPIQLRRWTMLGKLQL
jgi:hypothetical protein